MDIREFSEQMNRLAKSATPFLFVVDFEMRQPRIFRMDELADHGILFEINGRSGARVETSATASGGTSGSTYPVYVDEAAVDREQYGPNGKATRLVLEKHPWHLDDYAAKFNLVSDHLRYGDSYLTNLTIKTRVSVPLSLRELFFISRARYKLLFGDSFLVFSPEIFIQIENGVIRSFPMKGTIDARVDRAAETILNDEKELAEHITIVDLIRNDLSTVATGVEVERFRYLEKITTGDRELLQVSSSIRGTVAAQYADRPGDLLVALLPAGSVSGAPKNKTVQIIAEAEGEARGYYSGVFGIFDGQNLDSGVMIRFIEHRNGLYYYRSGGGITARSEMQKEYREAIDKIYVPVS